MNLERFHPISECDLDPGTECVIIINGNSVGTAVYDYNQNDELVFINDSYDYFKSDDVTHYLPIT